MAANYDDVMKKLGYLDDTKDLIATAIEEKGQDITDQDTFRAYVEKILNIETGDIKLFNTIEEMQNDEKAVNGDLAVVYNTQLKPISSDISFSEIVIPRTLSIGLTSTTNRYLSGIGFYVSISAFKTREEGDTTPPSTLYIELTSSKEQYRLYYNSDASGLNFTYSYGYYNGVAFTFDTDTFNFDFEQTRTVDVLDSVFVGLFNVKLVDFQGLFKYTINNLSNDTIYYGKNLTLDSNYAVNVELVGSADLRTVENKLYNQVLLEGYDVLMGLGVINRIQDKRVISYTIYDNNIKLLSHNDKINVLISGPYDTEDAARSAISGITYRKTTFNVDALTLLYHDLETSIQEITIGETTKYYVISDEIVNEDLITSWQFSRSGGNVGYICVYDPVKANDFYEQFYYHFENGYVDKYVYAPTQLTALNNSHLVTNKSAYGKNGVINGDGTYLKNVTTREFKDFFMPQMPDKCPVNHSYVLQYGSRVPYYTFVEREYIYCNDVNNAAPDDSLVVYIETILDNSYTSNLYNTIYNCDFHKTFYTENNNKLYFGYIGYNMTTRESPGNPGSYVHEKFNNIYGMLICLDDMTVYKSFSFTSGWEPFDGWGNGSEDPNANINCVNYDFGDDMFVFIIDTGTWAWNSSTAPFIGMLKIKGSTGAATTNRWQIGKHDAPREYVKANYMRYDVSTDSLIIPLYSWNKGGYDYSTHMILKLDASGNVTTWVDKGANIYNYSMLGEDESFYTKQPVFFFAYTDTNNVTHNILKRIDTGVELEIPSPRSYSDEYRAFYGNYMYYTGYSSTANTYVLYRADIPNMTITEMGVLPSTYSTFVLFNKVPHLVSGNRVYSLDNLTESMYNFYNTSDMYNDNRIDGIEIVDGAMQSMYPKAKTTSDGIQFNKYKQHLYIFRKPTSLPMEYDAYITWPSEVGSHTKNYCYPYQCVPIKLNNFNGTMTPYDYEMALNTAKQIEGK